MLSLPANHENDLYLLLHKCRVQKWLLLTAIGKNLTFIYYQICTFKTTYYPKVENKNLFQEVFKLHYFCNLIYEMITFFAVYNGKTWLAIVKWYHLLGKIAKLYSQLAQIPKKNGTLHFTSHSILFQAAILFFWLLHSAINFLKNVPYLMPVVFSNNFGTNQSGFTWESF